jgi:hypothetical protein
MRLQIVWRNPIPLTTAQQTVQRVRTEQFAALYVVTSSDITREFELILGDAAWDKNDARRAVAMNF